MVADTPSAKERALKWIRDSIVSGVFKGGEYIEESAVCEALGISRTPVREALNQAAEQKYVTLSRKRGAQVKTVSAVELTEVFKSRTLIEIHAAEIVCRSSIPVPDVTKSALRALKSTVATIEANPFDSVLIRERAQNDWALHFSLVEAAGNSVLADLYRSLQHWQLRVAAALSATPTQRDFLHLIDDEHTQIVEAWEQHDEDLLVETIKRHLQPHAEVVRFL